MRKIVWGVAALVVVGFTFVTYRCVWGTPFRFKDLLLRQAVVQVLDSPEITSMIGVADGTWYDFSSDKLDAYSLAERQRRFDRVHQFEREFAAFDRAKLTEQEKLSYDIIQWGFERSLSNEKYPWLGANSKLYPVEPAFGIQKNVINFLMSTHQIRNAKLARNYVARVKAIGPLIDAVREDIKRQADAGVVAPDFVIDHSIDQIKALIAPPPAKSPLVTHLTDQTAKIEIDKGERDKLIADVTAAVTDIVYPAYRRLIAEEQDLRKHATHDAGVWRLKDGDKYYADQLKLLTSTDMTPDEIHAYGLSEVARISAEADAILKSVGLKDGTVGERLDKLAADPRFLFARTDAGRQQQLQRYREILGRVKGELPKYFAHIPAIPLDVQRVPVFAEKGSAGAYYERPTLNGSRPGIFFANLRDPAETPTWAMPTLAYHEGIPGHHMQIATATEIQEMPYQRRLAYFPAYGEGWALYAEHLASDMGMYRDDPYGDLGRLQAELFRAVRLVVDTGMHAKHWSREQAIDYMLRTTGMAEGDVTAEIERYVVWPGQACAYKIGMKSILDLRTEAQTALGPKFNLKEYHTVVLENGAMPLWLLKRNVEVWIAARQAGR
jgi:uncharacterized protein (DUF885 family)